MIYVIQLLLLYIIFVINKINIKKDSCNSFIKLDVKVKNLYTGMYRLGTYVRYLWFSTLINAGK